MTISLRAAVIAMLAIAASWAQAQVTETVSDTAVYAGLSDLSGPDYATRSAAYEQISDTENAIEDGEDAEDIEADVEADTETVADEVEQAAFNVGLSDEIAQTAAGEPYVFADGAEGLTASPDFGISSTADDLPYGSCCNVSSSACGLPDVGCEPVCGAGTSCNACCSVRCGSLCTRQCPCCCGVGTHCTKFYGDALYLRARNNEVAYAVPSDGPIAAGLPAPIQVGNFGVLDPDYEVGFRAGLNVALDTVSSLDLRYTMFESRTEDQISATAPLVLRSLVTHPSTASATQDALAASASYDIDFDIADASYRHLWKCGGLCTVNYLVGARYARLEQQFAAEFVKNGIETVTTDIDFDGGGFRFGLETQRFSCRNQLHVYANGYASFLAGRFRAHYFQGQAFDPTVVNAEWEAGRVVPILDFEAGLGWTSCDGKLSLSAGYLVSAWFNTVTTQDYINAIQSNSYLDLSDSVWFDGLQARLQFSF